LQKLRFNKKEIWLFTSFIKLFPFLNQGLILKYLTSFLFSMLALFIYIYVYKGVKMKKKNRNKKILKLIFYSFCILKFLKFIEQYF